jgi:hypothetical protein
MKGSNIHGTASIAAMMLRGRKATGDGSVVERRLNPWKLGVVGLATGTLSGFYGIGGGFLVVPGLILGTGMPTIAAIGSSLVAVGAFGMTTALNYAVSGMVEWPTALLFIAGGHRRRLGWRASCETPFRPATDADTSAGVHAGRSCSLYADSEPATAPKAF